MSKGRCQNYDIVLVCVIAPEVPVSVSFDSSHYLYARCRFLHLLRFLSYSISILFFFSFTLFFFSFFPLA
ncbi:hypothetical protein BDZ91DRAFT_737791 [Kalaharituber pfeilii]|nr:hypothetical protein BDZ91DRAFT_737791 [Kalaharituber pfeilii]